MNFQENKFPIVLGGVTALLAGGLIFWGAKASGRYADAKGRYDSAVSELQKMNQSPIPPTEENVIEKRQVCALFCWCALQ